MNPGDIVFAHNSGWMARLIRVGEWLKLRQDTWNHVAILDRQIDGEWYVIQAEIRGVTNTGKLSEIAPGGNYEVIPCPCNASEVLRFARGEVGTEYGILTILAIAIDILTWSLVPSFRSSRRPSWICSALGAESLRFGGWYHRYNSVYDVTPQDVYDALVLGNGTT